MLNKIVIFLILIQLTDAMEAYILSPYVKYSHESHPQFSVQSNKIRTQTLVHHTSDFSSSWNHGLTWSQSHYTAELHSTQILKFIHHDTEGFRSLGFYWRQTHFGPQLGAELEWARWNQIHGTLFVQNQNSQIKVQLHPTPSTKFSIQYHLRHQWLFSWLKQVEQHNILFEYQPMLKTLKMSYSYHFSFDWTMSTRVTHHPSGMNTYQQSLIWIP